MRPARWIHLHKKIRYPVYGKPTHTRGSTSNDSPHGKGTGSALPEILLVKRVEPLQDSASLCGNHLRTNLRSRVSAASQLFFRSPIGLRSGRLQFSAPNHTTSRTVTMLYRKAMNSVHTIRFLECLHRGRASSFVTGNQHRHVVLVHSRSCSSRATSIQSQLQQF